MSCNLFKACFLVLLLSFSITKAQDITPKLIVQTGHSTAISKMEVHPTDNIIATGGFDGRVLLWDIDSRKQLNYFEGHQSPITALGFYGDTLATASSDGEIIFYNIVTHEKLNSIKSKYPVHSFAIDYKNQKLWSVGKGITILDIKNSQVEEIKELKLDKGHYNDIELHPSKQQIALSNRQNGKIEVYNIGDYAKPLRSYKLKAVQVKFDSSGRYIYGAGLSGKIRRWHTEKSKLFHYSITSKKWIDSFLDVAFDQKLNYFAGANRDGKIYVYNNNNGDIQYILEGHHNRKVSNIAFSNDGNYLLSSGADRVILIWDIRDGQLVGKMKGLGGIINSIDYANTSITTGDQNGVCRIFSLNNDVNTFHTQLKLSSLKTFLNWHVEAKDLRFNTDATAVIVKAREYKEKIKPNNAVSLKQKTKFFEWDYLSGKLKPLKFEVAKKYFIGEKISLDEFEWLNQDNVNAYHYLEDKELLLTTENDAILHFYDDNGKEKFKYIPVKKEDRIQLTPENYYWATKGALDGVGFNIGKKVFSFDQFDVLFNRPDKVLLADSDPDPKLVEHYEKAYLKRINKLGVDVENISKDLTKIPQLSIDKYNLPKSVKSSSFKFAYKTQDKYSTLSHLKATINGVPVNASELPRLKGNQAEGSLELELSEGVNRVELTSVNQGGKESLKQEFTIQNKAHNQKKTAYVVAMGVSSYQQSDYSLRYAHKDAQDMIRMFQRSKFFDNVKTMSFVNAEATKDKVEDMKEFVSQAGVNDVVIVFFAGHGLLDQNYNYFLAPFNIDFNNPSDKGIPYGDLQEILSSTKSRKKVLFLDACHSGEIDKEEIVQSIPQEEIVEEDIVFRHIGSAISIEEASSFELSKSLFADLRENDGSFVISSAGGAEYAIEGEEWNNGLFTYALINGLVKGKADLNNDKRIMMDELQKFIFDRVATLSDGRQVPTSRVENLKSNYRIW